jgi:hypothetical protein
MSLRIGSSEGGFRSRDERKRAEKMHRIKGIDGGFLRALRFPPPSKLKKKNLDKLDTWKFRGRI